MCELPQQARCHCPLSALSSIWSWVNVTWSNNILNEYFWQNVEFNIEFNDFWRYSMFELIIKIYRPGLPRSHTAFELIWGDEKILTYSSRCWNNRQHCIHCQRVGATCQCCPTWWPCGADWCCSFSVQPSMRKFSLLWESISLCSKEGSNLQWRWNSPSRQRCRTRSCLLVNWSPGKKLFSQLSSFNGLPLGGRGLHRRQWEALLLRLSWREQPPSGECLPHNSLIWVGNTEIQIWILTEILWLGG